MVRDEALYGEAGTLAQAAMQIVAENEGRLVGLTIQVPRGVAHEGFRKLLARRLAEIGLDFVDVDVDPDPGAMRIVAADFHR